MEIFSSLKSEQFSSLHLVCQKLLLRANVKFTKSHLARVLGGHIDFPSLLAVKDVLDVYGINTVAIRKGKHSYNDFETPFICSIQKSTWPDAGFILVEKVEDGRIFYTDPDTHRSIESCVTEVEKLDKGAILLINLDSARNEENFFINRREERLAYIIRLMPIFILISGTIFSMLNARSDFSFGISDLFLVTSLAGLLLSLLLIKHEINSNNSFVREVCGAFGKQSNCDAVLLSNQSKFIGVSWSNWGCTYFASFFVNMILFRAEIGNLWIWSLISVSISPYILFSIYYQWQVVKQWCPICLGIQFLIALNAVGGILFFQKEDILMGLETYYYLFAALFFAGMAFFISYAITPILKELRDNRHYEMRWKKIRYSPIVFKSLLEKNDNSFIPAEGLGILLGNKNASTEIIKVCNPYCGPCSKAHPELEEIVRRNPNVKVRVIFAVSGEDSDIKTAPVRHLLAINDKFDKLVTHKALDDWYTSDVKDYEIFAKRYPVDTESGVYKSQMIAMRNWCDTMKVRATPTLFINGKELPDTYGVKDLKYFF